MSHRSSITWCAALCSVLAACMPCVAQSRNGTTSSMSRGDGHTLESASGWALGQGYRPVNVRLMATAVAANDREYTIEVTSRDVYGWDSTVTRDRLVIPANARAGSAVLSVSQPGMWGVQTIEVSDPRGNKLEKLSHMTQSSPNYWNMQAAMLPSFLHVSEGFIDTSMLSEAFAAGGTNLMNMGISTSTVNGRAQFPTELFQQVAVSELTDRWIDYTSADVVCMSLTQLRELSQNRPEALRAIVTYVSAGGNLWIWDAGANGERLPELDAITGLWSAGAPDWAAPNPSDYFRGLDGSFAVNRSVDYTQGTAVQEVIETQNRANRSRDGQPAPEPAFRVRDAQLGRVVAFFAAQPMANVSSTEDRDQLVWAINATGAARMIGKRRQGVSMSDSNTDFWNLMIPGVGEAPVTAFRVLITVFVIAIGPVNYYWLKRRGKLHLLLAVVPITAFVVTVGLFAYALLTDGLHVRVRPRTLTSIDQQRQHAATWSRMTYYAGLSPSGGLQFENDTVILPIMPQPPQGYPGASRAVNWLGDRQQLASGWLYSRTPTQFLTMRSRSTTRGLRIKPQADGGPPSVTNALGTNLVHLLLCDEAGRLYRAGATASGAACALTPLKEGEAHAAAFALMNERDAVFMPDMQLTDLGNIGRRRYVYYPNNNNFTPHQSDGLLEGGLSTAKSWLQTPSLMPKRNYIAIVERSSEVDFGLAEPVQEMPLHVVHGRW